jgi:hypothetical protein
MIGGDRIAVENGINSRVEVTTTTMDGAFLETESGSCASSRRLKITVHEWTKGKLWEVQWGVGNGRWYGGENNCYRYAEDRKNFSKMGSQNLKRKAFTLAEI